MFGRDDYETVIIERLLTGHRDLVFATVAGEPISFQFNGTEQMQVAPGQHVMIKKIAWGVVRLLSGSNLTYVVVCPVQDPFCGYGFGHVAYLKIDDQRIVDIRYTPAPSAQAYRYVMNKVWVERELTAQARHTSSAS